MKKVNILCFLFGHKISKTTDSGYHICNRCEAHEYYDREYSTNWDNSGWIWAKPLFWIKYKLFILKLSYRYLKFRYLGKDNLPF